MIGEVLRADIEAYAMRLRSSSALLDRARQGKVSPAVVTRYLSSIHYLVRHTPLHLRLAQDRATEMGWRDLASHFEQKLAEEGGHDRWAEDDMASIRTISPGVPESGPAASMRDLVAYIGDTIRRAPASYLAYILFAEYLTVLVGPEWLAVLEERCALPSSSMTVIGNHVVLDRAHVSEGLRAIDAVVSDEGHLPAMRDTLLHSMRYFDAFCDELCVGVA